MDLEESNKKNEAIWFKSYSAKEAYNLTSLSATEWDSLINKFMNEKNLFEKYYA